MPTYLRCDTGAPVPASTSILWGPDFGEIKVRRPALDWQYRVGQVPYLPISAMLAVRLVPEATSRPVLILLLAARDGWDCLYCGETLDKDSATIEHVVSRAHDGPHHLGNMALACASCNHAAGHLDAAAKVRLAVRNHIGRAVVAAEARGKKRAQR